MFAASVVNLAVDTRAYKFLFGTVQHSGIRTKAYLDEFASANVVNVESLANEVASELVDKGQLDEAIELYDLASVSTHLGFFYVSISTPVVNAQVFMF